MGEVSRVYAELGGILQPWELNLRAWDIEFDGIAVELDEHLHFNRYRLWTLCSPLYGRLSRFPLAAYREFCADREPDCREAGKWGGRWTNKSCEKQFGPAGEQGELSGAGSPRWKQRAFYDYVKDLAPLLVGVRVARISIWDTLDDGGERTVRQILSNPAPNSGQRLAELISARAGR
jgi:hypothetical protein